MFRWIAIGLVALAALFLTQADPAQAISEDYLGANHRQDGYVDFNGDGKTDVFTTNGINWQVSYGGTSVPQVLKDSSWKLENSLCFGDFDGNGKTDVFLSSAGSWYVSYDGTSALTKIKTSGYSYPDLAFGDFDGDGKTDVFRAGGSDWWVAYGGTSAWTKINGSDYRLRRLAFGDFNGDGKTDVFRPDGSDWYVSYGGTSSWTKINGSNYELGNHLAYGTDYFQGDLALGDFDADGKTDVFRADAASWYVSYGGTSSWTLVKQWVYEPDKLHFADFDRNRQTDIFKTVYDPYGWMVWFNQMGPFGGFQGFVKDIIYPTGPPPDLEPPVISEVKVQSLTSTSAIITWTTDEPATSRVRFGVAPSRDESTEYDSNLTTSHRQALTILGFTELIPDTLYYFRVYSRDAAGHLSSADGTFTTPPESEADTTPPTISAVQAINITPTSATITWTTDEPSDSGVAWGPTTSYGFLESIGSLVAAHSKTLQNLSPDTLYHFRARSRDAAGNLAISADSTFTTPAAADTTPPVISGVQATNITSTSATITWNTDEGASSQVEFGPTTSYGSLSTLDSSLVTSHSQALSGLSADTLYHYRVLSRDAAGNLATSPDYTFTTSAAPGGQFSDVAGSPYRDQINDLANRGVISGYPDGTFRPNNPVIRQQFAKMIVKALELPVSTGDISPFADVMKSEPGSYVDLSDIYYPDHYVAVCAREGITVGKTPTSFAPYDNISRAQLVTMVARAANLADPPAGYTPPFNQFDNTHYPFARRAAYAGLLAGLQGLGPSYNFFAPATRGEVCLLLYNLLHN